MKLPGKWSIELVGAELPNGSQVQFRNCTEVELAGVIGGKWVRFVNEGKVRFVSAPVVMTEEK